MFSVVSSNSGLKYFVSQTGEHFLSVIIRFTEVKVNITQLPYLRSIKYSKDEVNVLQIRRDCVSRLELYLTSNLV